MKEELLALSIAGTPIETPTGVIQGGDIGGIIGWIVLALTSVGIIAGLIFLILGAIKWITSGGDKEKLESARRTVIFSIIGLIIVIMSVVVMHFINNLLFGGGAVSPPSSKEPGKSVGNCPDGSGNYTCGATPNTHCPLCSSDPTCNTGKYSIASCSGTASCQVDADCYGLPHGCPVGQIGTVHCNKQFFQSNGHCETTDCHPVPFDP